MSKPPHTTPSSDFDPGHTATTKSVGSNGSRRFVRDLHDLFDAGYYLEQLDVKESIASPIDHYLVNWATSLASPHPLFDMRFYLAKNPDIAHAEVEPFAHFLTSGWSERRDFHPYIDTNEALSRHDSFRSFADHWDGHETADAGSFPSALLRVETLRRSIFRVYAQKNADLETADVATPHDLFRILGTSRSEFPLLEYLDAASFALPALERVRVSVAALFDLDWYQVQCRSLGIQVENPILHFIEEGESLQLSPNVLFDIEKFTASRFRRAYDSFLDAFVACFSTEAGRRVHLHELFDPTHYRMTRLRAPMVDLGHSLAEYLGECPEERRPPTPFFDGKFYREVYLAEVEPDVDPFEHYLKVGHSLGHWPHPAFDPAFYSRKHMSRRSDRNPLADFASRSGVRPTTLAFFDAANYLEWNEDVRRHALCPVSHYLGHGFQEGRTPNFLSSEYYVLSQNPTKSYFMFGPAVQDYIRNRSVAQRDSKARPRVLLVGHDASRTGAPLILLNIARELSSQFAFDVFIILDSPGDAVFDFSREGHLHVMRTNRFAIRGNDPLEHEAFRSEICRVVDLLADDPPAFAFVNTMECAPYLPVLKSLGIPTIALIHEFPDFYAPKEFPVVEENADSIICPAEFVAQRWRRAMPGSADRISVISQGLLRSNFGQVSWRDKRAAFGEYGIRDDDFVVIGCGTADGRKGIDIFIDVARQVCGRIGDERRAFFVWVGGGFESMLSHGRWEAYEWDLTKFWAEWDCRDSALQDRFKIIGSSRDVEAYFASADVFLMTSRADPFPCVIHEAMATGLAIVTFADSGGAPEALQDCGIVVPRYDRTAMVDAVLRLMDDPTERQALGHRASERVRSQYRFDEYVSKLVASARATPAVATESTVTRWEKPIPKVSSPKIIFTSPDWGVSGVNTFTQHLANYLNANGLPAEVLFTCGRFGHLYSSNTPDVAHEFLQPRDGSRVCRLDALEQFLVDRAPCILVPNYDYEASSISARLPSGVGIVGIAHSDDPMHYEHCYRLGLYWNAIVGVSDEVSSTISRLNPAFASKLHTIPYGVPFPSSTQIEAASTRESSISERIRILYVGRLVQEQKRILDFAHLARALDARAIPFELVLVGEGEQEEHLRHVLSPWLASGAVKLPGRMTHDEIYRTALDSHAFVLLSDYEGLPLSLIEAMGCGCVPVVSDIESGVKSLVTNDATGFICRPREWESFAARIESLRADGVRWRRMSVAARARVHDMKLDVEGMGSQYKDLFDRILASLEAKSDARHKPLTVVNSLKLIPPPSP